MSSFGVVAFSKVERLLSKCAPGSELILKKHLYWVRFNGLTYRGLPKGGHGKHEVKIGTIEQMVKYLFIDRECCKLQVPALNLKEETKEEPK
jgi:hypothetical protein